MDTKICSNEIGMYAQNMITILGSIVNIIGETYVTINEHENVQFDNEYSYKLQTLILSSKF